MWWNCEWQLAQAKCLDGWKFEMLKATEHEVNRRQDAQIVYWRWVSLKIYNIIYWSFRHAVHSMPLSVNRFCSIYVCAHDGMAFIVLNYLPMNATIHIIAHLGICARTSRATTTATKYNPECTVFFRNFGDRRLLLPIDWNGMQFFFYSKLIAKRFWLSRWARHYLSDKIADKKKLHTLNASPQTTDSSASKRKTLFF